MSYWNEVRHIDGSSHYSVAKVRSVDDGMHALRAMFQTGQADEANFVLFSTSGVHGSYTTIEEVEGMAFVGPGGRQVTFLLVQPRLVTIRYGLCRPETEDDFAFLKRLRSSSHAAVAQIGLSK